MHYAKEAQGEVQRKAYTYWHYARLARGRVILCTGQRQGS